jgi:hypothetical protein
VNEAAMAPDSFLYKEAIATRIQRRDKPANEYDRREQQQPRKRRNDIKRPFK